MDAGAGSATLPFTFAGLVVASVFYSLPFMVQPILNSMQALGERPLEAAATLRASPLDTFFSVVLPLCRPGLVTGCIMSFAHTVGEFGVVLMVGGNIPGVTRVVSVQIFDHVEALEYADAHRLAAVMLAFSFSVLLALQVTLGLINVIGQVPLLNAVAHNLTAACLLATLVLLMGQMHASAGQRRGVPRPTSPAHAAA